MTRLGRSLGIVTTAEGVETEEQLEILRIEDCTQVQGYLFSPPRPCLAAQSARHRAGGPSAVYAAGARAGQSIDAMAAVFMLTTLA